MSCVLWMQDLVDNQTIGQTVAGLLGNLPEIHPLGTPDEGTAGLVRHPPTHQPTRLTSLPLTICGLHNRSRLPESMTTSTT